MRAPEPEPISYHVPGFLAHRNCDDAYVFFKLLNLGAIYNTATGNQTERNINLWAYGCTV